MATLRAPLLAQTPGAPLLDDGSGTRSALREAQIDAAGGNSFTNSFQGSLVGSEANDLGAEEAGLRAAGDPRSMLRADQLRSRITGLQGQGAAYATAPQSFQDVIKDPSKIGSWAAGAAGQGLGSSVGQMATGVGFNAAASAVGIIPHPIAKAVSVGLRMAGPMEMFRQNSNLLAGEAYNAIVDDPVAMQRSAADINSEVVAHGRRAALLDTASQVLPVAQMTRGFGKPFANALAKVPTAAKFAGEAAMEGGTETLQQIDQHYTHENLNPNRDASGDKWENIDSLLSGAAGGVAMGIPGHIGEKALHRLGVPAEGKRGDDVGLDDETSGDIVKDMGTAKANPKYDRAAREKTLADIQGFRPDGLTPEQTESWNTNSAEIRKQALLKALAEDGSAKATKLAEAVNAVDGSDMVNSFDPAFEDAADHLLQDGPYSAKSIAKMAEQESKRGKKFNLEDDGTFSAPYSSIEVGPQKSSPSAAGSPFRSSVRGDTRGKLPSDGPTSTVGKVGFGGKDAVEPGQRLWEGVGTDPTGTKPNADVRWIAANDHKSKATETADTLWHSFGQADTGHAANEHSQALVDNFSEEIAAMTSEGVKPTPEALDRAEHIGRVVGSMLGKRTEGFIKAAGTINGTSEVFKHMADSATAFSGAGNKQQSMVQLTRDKATDLVLNLVSPEARKKMLTNGVSILEDRHAQDMLVDQLEKAAKGESRYKDGHLEALFGKAALKKMMAVVSPGRIEPLNKQGKSIWGDLQAYVAEVEGATRKGNEDATDASDFDRTQEEKSLDKLPPTSMVFHHQHKVGHVKAVGQAFAKYNSPTDDDKTRMILPHLIRYDEKDPENKNGFNQKTFSGEGTPLDLLMHNAVKTMRGQGKNMKTGAMSARQVMDRMKMSAKQREDLMFAYMEQEGDKNSELGAEERYLMKGLRYLAGQKTKFDNVVSKRGKLSPKDAAEIQGAHVSVTKIEELAASADDVALLHKVMQPKTDPHTKANAIAGIVNRAYEALAAHLGGKDFEKHANAYFDKRHMVVAEQLSNPDPMAMPLTTFRELADAGKLRLNETDKAGMKGLKAQREHRAALGLIEFKTPYSTNKTPDSANRGTEVIQASELVKWVRDMENAHSTDDNMSEKQKREAAAKRGTDLGKAESFRNHLSEGITALITQGYIAKGEMPWITNAAGQREEFTKGALPPSLDLGGMTQAQLQVQRAREDADTINHREVDPNKSFTTAWADDISGPIVDAKDLAYDEQVAREQNRESSVQDVEAVDDQLRVEAGSKKWDDAWDTADEQNKVLLAAANKPPQALTFTSAFRHAKSVGDGLWGGMLGTKAETDAAFGRILAMARALDRPAKLDRDAGDNIDAMVGGAHYAVPLAALLTPQHLAQVQAYSPISTERFGGLITLRNKVAAKILTMNLSPAQLTKVVDLLSGKTAKAEQEKLDKKNVPTDPDQLASWQKNKKEALAADVVTVTPAQQKPWLEAMAAKYVQRRVAQVTGKPWTDRSDQIMPNQAKGLGGPEKDMSAVIALIDKAEAEVAGIKSQIAELTAQDVKDVPSIAALSRRLIALETKLEGRVLVIKEMAAAATAAPTAHPAEVKTRANVHVVTDEKGNIHKDTSTKHDPEVRKPKTPALTGLGRTTQTAPFVSQETADYQGEEIAERVDTLTGKITKGLETKGEPMTPRTFADLPPYKPGQKSMTYAGIGSRETPANVMAVMKKVAARMAELGYTLHSGGAQGADTAFESGAGENTYISEASDSTPETRAIAHEIHPKGALLGKLATNLMARNTNQVFGADLNSPVDFVLAWTPDGAESTAERNIGTGGTGQAIDMASRKGVPVINMAKKGWQDRIKEVLAGTHAAQQKSDTVNIWHGSGENAELSNLASRPFEYEGRSYVSVEHAYQSNKSGEFDQETSDKYKTAGKKIRGSGVPKTDGQWNIKLMGKLVRASFQQNPDAAKALLATGEAKLTHTQDKGMWAKYFPQILEKVRGELTGKKLNNESDSSVIDRVERAKRYREERKNRLGAQGKMGATTDKIEQQKADTALAVTSAKAHLLRTLGSKIKSIFKEAFPGYKGAWDGVTQTVEIATANPYKIMQLAYHESMHGFYTNILKGMPETKAMLERTMNTPEVMNRLKAYLAGSPKALAAIESDPEERVAYAYQFWAAGLLDLGHEPQGFMEKAQAFLRKVFNAVRDDEKALAIFTAFTKGELVELSPAGKAITKIMESGQWRKAFAERFDKQTEWAKSIALPAIDVLLDSDSETLQKMALQWWRNPADASQASMDGEEGVLDATARVHKQYQNQVNDILTKLTMAEVKELAKHLNDKKNPMMPTVKAAQQKVFALNSHFLKYLRDAGVNVGERDNGQFYPVVYDMEHVIEQKDAFTTMLKTEYPQVLKSMQAAYAKAHAVDRATVTVDDAADAVHQAIIDQGGVDKDGLSPMREDGILAPYFASENKREFDWIRAEHRAPYLSEDVVATLTRYYSQGTRSAEYVRQFGKGGQLLRDAMSREGDFQMMGDDGRPVYYETDGPVVRDFKRAATKLKLSGVEHEQWVARRMEDAQRANGALEGVLGKNISANFRKLNAAVGVYNGFRLLALSLFSAMLDPNGIKIAGGEHEDMMQAYKRGLQDVWGTWKDALLGNQIGKFAEGDQDAVNAAIAGTIDSNMSLESMGTAHTSEYNAGFAHHANRFLFIGNGLTAWDRSMRIMATRAAMKFIARHDANGDPVHSKRWMAGLGLKQGEVTIVDGLPIIDRSKLIAHRMATYGTTYEEEATQATADIKKIHIALNRWVNRAIITPNAAQRPTWGSDPHYQMMIHLKQYTYGFHKTTMKYAMDEMKAGNNAPASQMMVGVPIMIAADMTKAMITGGGSLPGYMANWTMVDWLLHGWARSGNNGIGQFGVDALTNPTSLLGPMGQQLLDIPFGDSTPVKKVLKAVPGVSVFASTLSRM